VDVGQDREAFLLQARQDAQALLQPRPTVGGPAAAVGLVEGRLEYEPAHPAADFARQEMHVLFTFDDAGSGDQRERVGPADLRQQLNWHG
jgi:hypothetical protein